MLQFVHAFRFDVAVLATKGFRSWGNKIKFLKKFLHFWGWNRSYRQPVPDSMLIY